MARRNPVRYLVPVALIATIAGAYLIVDAYLTRKHDTPKHHVVVSFAPKGKYKRTTFYTVQANDTLTSVSRRTGVPISRLEALNPTINPDALQTGQRIRLRR
jgi:LysM repeat protein